MANTDFAESLHLFAEAGQREAGTSSHCPELPAEEEKKGSQRMKKLAIFAAVASFAVAGCDSKAENEVEEQAEAIDEAYEADADLEEAMTEGGPDEEAGEAKADQLRETGEETKDELEDAADEMDSTPQ